MLTPDTRGFKILAAWRQATRGAPERVAPSAGSSAPPRTWRAGPGRTPGGRGAENVGSSPLASSHLISSHLISWPAHQDVVVSHNPQVSRLQGRASSQAGRAEAEGVGQEKQGNPAWHTGQRARSSRGWGKKTLGSGSALSLRKCQMAPIKISTTTEALFSFHSQHKCFGKINMLKIALAASADACETAGVLPLRWLEAESSRGFLLKLVKSLPVGRNYM